jgi:NitT/TauT family transport system substrate-binding protein
MKMRILSAILVIISMVLSACGSAPAPSEKTPLRIAYTDWAGDYVTLIALKMGLFEKHGVAVEPIYYPSYSDSYTNLAVGKVDAINAVLIDVFPAIKNNDLRAVMVTDSSEGGDSIVAVPDIQSIYALRGKRIGVELGTFGELFIAQMLAKAGMTERDVTLVNIAPEDVPSAIPSLIDAGHIREAQTAKALVNGNHVIFSTASTPGLFPDVMTFRAEVTQNRPDDIRAFVAAWFEAAEYWITNPQAGNTIVAQYTGKLASTVSTKGVHIYTLQENLQAFSENSGSDSASIYYVAHLSLEFSIRSGYITTPPDINILLDPSFLK